jgi:hypothetical protein
MHRVVGAVALDIARFLDTSGNPEGRPYRATPVPGKQPTMPRATLAKARPAGAPAPVDLASITVPAADETKTSAGVAGAAKRLARRAARP